MKTSLSSSEIDTFLAPLSEAERRFGKQYPGESGARQPVHTVYGGAHLFKASTAKKLGELGTRVLQTYAPDAFTFARALDLPGSDGLPTTVGDSEKLIAAVQENPESGRRINRAAWLATTVYDRITEKLAREAVEDFRIDFEDGYGNRPDQEEDGDAVRTAGEVALGMKEGTLPPFIGIRIKPLTAELRARSIRTLDLFLSELCAKTDKALPENFVVTLPKVTIPEQVSTLVKLFEAIETKTGRALGSLRMEIMVEQTQVILGGNGTAPLPALIAAGDGRIVAAHFGTYDYTASCNITAAHQGMTHATCDFAKHVMLVTLANTGVWLSDGATTIMPIPPHSAAKDGPPLNPRQIAENVQTVHRAWKLHFDQATHSLVNGFYQGWDLHPGQLPTRYAAVFTFFLEGLDTASERLTKFVDRAAQATLVGDVFDDAATGQGLLNYFLRAKNSGALTEEEAVKRSGLTSEELGSRSFVKILDGRRKR